MGVKCESKMHASVAHCGKVQVDLCTGFGKVQHCVERWMKWDQKLQVLMMASQSTKYKSTRYTPVKLITSFELYLLVDQLNRETT